MLAWQSCRSIIHIKIILAAFYMFEKGAYMARVIFEETEEVHATKTVRKSKIIFDLVEDNQ